MYPRCDAIVSVVILGGSLLSARMAQAGELVLPSIMTPPFAGRHYGATVPDTFDLAERMRLSVNGFTRAVSGPPENPFPRVQYRAQHFINIAAMPPTVTRSIPLYGKYMLGLLMDRIVTGSDQSTFIDDDWRQGWLDWARINPVPGGPEVAGVWNGSHSTSSVKTSRIARRGLVLRSVLLSESKRIALHIETA